MVEQVVPPTTETMTEERHAMMERIFFMNFNCKADRAKIGHKDHSTQCS
jgi:hypothetical protein